MAAWLTVYCTRSVSHVGAGDLLKSLDVIDFYTVAEGFGIEDEAAVEQALAQLRVEPVSEPEGARFCLRYRPTTFRPVLVHLWAEPGKVQEACDETLEQIHGRKGRGISRVRSHLARIVEVVAVELSWGQTEDMGVVLGGQVAEFFAPAGGGLIRDQNDDWWAVRDGVPVVLVGPKRRA
jgi:hypothetical protein